MDKRKSIMILGASILQEPAIRKAKDMGLTVIAVDKDKNAVGFKYADVCLEISTIDTIKITEAAKEHNIDGIMTLATDMPVRSVAAVAEELNLNGISVETAQKVTNKSAMRECLQKHNVPIPIFLCVNEYKSYLEAVKKFKNKYIVKPVDNSGSRGVYLVNNKYDKNQIDYAFENSKQYSTTGDVIIEEFMEGPEVSVEALSIEGIVHIIAITDKLTTGAPRFVEMGHSQPSQLNSEVKKQIEKITKKAVNVLGITTGASHTEIIVTKEGPKIVEIGARLGGDNITTQLVPLSTGIDIVKCCIDIAIGVKTNIDKKFNAGSAIRYFKTDIGIIKKIHYVEEAKQLFQLHQVIIMKNVGDHIYEIRNSADRIGYIIAQADNAEKATIACNNALSYISIEIA